MSEDGRTVWTRLEPDARDGRMEEGLRARVHDPMWMLTRQWQLGEFDGEDAGSPVDVYVDLAFDDVSRYQPVGESDEATGSPETYDGGPLEPIVEGEPVVTGKREPNVRLAAQGGRTFLRLLGRHLGTDPGVEDVPDGYELEDVSGDADEPFDEAGRRYVDFVGGRVLDGHRIFLAIDAALSGGSWTPNPTLPWENDPDWDGPTAMPVPTGADPGKFETAAREYHGWYDDLYEEPQGGGAWDPTRMEYDFHVSTGGPDGESDGTTETVLSTEGYTGGRLDWPNFSPVRADDETPSVQVVRMADPQATDGDSPEVTLFGDGETGGTTDRRSKHFLPTKVRFKGMPSRRYWEFEDADVDLSEISADDVSSQSLLNFALVYGNDWYSFPVDTPLGSMVRVETLTVTDTFGITDPVESITDENWNAFSVRDLPNHDEPGLFLPPVLDGVTESDPVERVSLSRDEMANLAFAVEQRFEDRAGDGLDRGEYVAPELVVETVSPADSVEEEYVEFHNPGREPLDVSGWVVTNGSERFTFGTDTVVGTGETVTLHSGTEPKDEDSPTALYWGSKTPVWNGSGNAETVVLSVYEDPTSGQAGNLTDDRLQLRKRIPLRSQTDLPEARYALATDLFDHWFALKPSAEEYVADVPDEGEDGNLMQTRYRHFLELALVLDAETLDAATIADLPDPEGRILRPYPDDDQKSLRIYDEELHGGGTEVTRSYQKATWTDGTTYLWSGREASAGKDDVGSGNLRYDVLENWTGEDGN